MGGSWSARRVPKGPEIEAEGIFAMLHFSENLSQHTIGIDFTESESAWYENPKVLLNFMFSLGF